MCACVCVCVSLVLSCLNIRLLHRKGESAWKEFFYQPIHYFGLIRILIGEILERNWLQKKDRDWMRYIYRGKKHWHKRTEFLEYFAYSIVRVSWELLLLLQLVQLEVPGDRKKERERSRKNERQVSHKNRSEHRSEHSLRLIVVQLSSARRKQSTKKPK